MYACSGGCVAGPSFQMKKGHYLADVLAVKNAAFGKDFHREQGDYELPGFELRKNFGYCSAQEQEEVQDWQGFTGEGIKLRCLRVQHMQGKGNCHYPE